MRLFNDPARRAEAAALLRRDASAPFLDADEANGPGWRQRRRTAELRAEAAEIFAQADNLDGAT